MGMTELRDDFSRETSCPWGAFHFGGEFSEKVTFPQTCVAPFCRPRIDTNFLLLFLLIHTPVPTLP
jgi:hypothetical protein